MKRRWKKLPPRYITVYNHLVEGLSNAEIASQMGITNKTVRQYLTDIYLHYKVKRREQLIVRHWKEIVHCQNLLLMLPGGVK